MSRITHEVKVQRQNTKALLVVVLLGAFIGMVVFPFIKSFWYGALVVPPNQIGFWMEEGWVFDSLNTEGPGTYFIPNDCHCAILPNNTLELVLHCTLDEEQCTQALTKKKLFGTSTISSDAPRSVKLDGQIVIAFDESVAKSLLKHEYKLEFEAGLKPSILKALRRALPNWSSREAYLKAFKDELGADLKLHHSSKVVDVVLTSYETLEQSNSHAFRLSAANRAPAQTTPQSGAFYAVARPAFLTGRPR